MSLSDAAAFMLFSPEARARALALLRAWSSSPPTEDRARSGKGPEAADGSSGPAGATNATPGPNQDTLGVPESERACNTPTPFHPIRHCPRCKETLLADGSCTDCEVQFVGISADVADRVNFELSESGAADAETPAAPPRYREYWDVDEYGCAIMCFKSRSTGWQVWLPCFMNYMDHFGDTQTRFPFWFCPQRFDALTVRILADLTPNQMKERAAHIPGRITSEHQRRYDSDTFQRQYYWQFMDTHVPWQTREERKAVIVSSHRQVGCKDSDCRKRHRAGRR